MTKTSLRIPILYFMSTLMFLAFALLNLTKLGFYGQTVFQLSGLKLILVNLAVGSKLVFLPLPVRLLAVLTLLTICFSFFALRKRHYLAFGISMLSTSVLTIATYLSLNLLQNTVKTTEGLGKLVYIPKEGFLVLLALGIIGGLMALWNWNHEKLFEYIFLFSSTTAVLSVAVITIYMIIMGGPAIAKIGLFNFIFGTVWKPTAASPEFGIGAMILTTIYGTFGAILIGVPIGVLTAVFLAEIAPPTVTKIIRPAIELLAGIPSVIYGFFGLMIIVPFVRDTFHQPVGDSLLSVMIILGIMVLPTIISISETSLRAVPSMYKEASLALGATHIQSIFKVIIPAARSGILAGIILGVGRAIGETMAVIMVAGNVVNMPHLLTPVRPMTAGIVLEMAYSADLHRQALFGIGLILFLFIMLVNITFKVIMKKAGAKYEG